MNLAKPRRSSLRRRLVWAVGAVAALAIVAAALVFEPWKLVVDQRVQEDVPAVSAVAPAAPAGGAASVTEPIVLARGTLISHEHESSGTVVLLRLADGSRVLRLEDLKTSNGPRLQVWLSDAPVQAGPAGWTVFDDGRHVDLGDLKGNIGSSNYPIPADVDLTSLSSVSIWCARFHVSFAAAQLNPTRLTDQARPAPSAGPRRSPRRGGAARGEEGGHGIGVGQLLRRPDGAERTRSRTPPRGASTDPT